MGCDGVGEGWDALEFLLVPAEHIDCEIACSGSEGRQLGRRS